MLRTFRPLPMLALALAAVWHSASASAWAQGYVYPAQRNYSGIIAGMEAHEVHEALRYTEIAQQIDLNERLLRLSFSYAPPWYGPPVGYGPYPVPWRWPYLPPPVRHPIGHATIPLGPDRWLSRPLHAPDELLMVEEDLVLPAPAGGPREF